MPKARRVLWKFSRRKVRNPESANKMRAATTLSNPVSMQGSGRKLD